MRHLLVVRWRNVCVVRIYHEAPRTISLPFPYRQPFPRLRYGLSILTEHCGQVGAHAVRHVTTARYVNLGECRFVLEVGNAQLAPDKADSVLLINPNITLSAPVTRKLFEAIARGNLEFI